jgi:hypothetical protein
MKKILCMTALMLTATALPAQSAEKLNVKELNALAPGSYNVSVYGLVKLVIDIKPGGAISGVNQKKKRDTGVWSVRDEKLCIKWNRWLKGKQRCTSLSGENGTYSGGGLYIRKI